MSSSSVWRLFPAQVLDARASNVFAANPTVGADNIPAHELAQSVFRLPSKEVKISIAQTGSEALEALIILRDLGYQTELVQPEYSLPTSDRYRLWSPPHFLLETAKDLRKGRALCLACGAGREAVTLAAEGWEVTAIDILPDALDRARVLESCYLPEGREAISWHVADLRKPLPPEFRGFDFVTQLRFWHSMTKSHLTQTLKPRGTGLIECFSPSYWKKRGRPNQGWPPEAWEGWSPLEVIEGPSARITVRRPD